MPCVLPPVDASASREFQAVVSEGYPQLGFERHSGLIELNYMRLMAGELDLHFGTLPQGERLPDFLAATPLLKVRSRVIAGAQHPFVRKKNVTPADLARYPWAVLHHGREVIKRLLAVIDQAVEGKVGISVELTSLAAMVQLLQAGPYLACFAEGLPMLQPQLGLAIPAYPRPIWQHPAGVVMHRSLTRCAPARELVEHVPRRAAALARDAAQSAFGLALGERTGAPELRQAACRRSTIRWVARR